MAMKDPWMPEPGFGYGAGADGVVHLMTWAPYTWPYPGSNHERMRCGAIVAVERIWTPSEGTPTCLWCIERRRR